MILEMCNFGIKLDCKIITNLVPGRCKLPVNTSRVFLSNNLVFPKYFGSFSKMVNRKTWLAICLNIDIITCCVLFLNENF